MKIVPDIEEKRYFTPIGNHKNIVAWAPVQASRPPFSKFWGAILGHRKREKIYMFFEAPQVRITLWWNLGCGVRPKLYKNTVVWAPLKSSKSTPDLRGGTPDLLRGVLRTFCGSFLNLPARSKIGSRGPFKASKNRFVHCECGGAATTEVLVDRRI